MNNNTFNANIVWAADPAERLKKAQKFVDKECLRLMSQYTPFRTGTMERSATLGTVIGSGKIVYNSPYARYLYYGVVYGPNIPLYVNGELEGFFSKKGVKKQPANRMLNYDKTAHPQAQRLWFEVMKRKHGNAILRGAAAISGGRAE